MNLSDYLKGNSIVSGTPTIQPNIAKVSDVDYKIGHIVKEPYLAKAFTLKPIVTSPLGYNEANPTTFYREPRGATVYGTTATRQSDSTNKGSCSK